MLVTFCKLHCGVGAGCRLGFPHDCLRPADGQSPAIRNDNLQFSVTKHRKRDAHCNKKHQQIV